MCAHLYSIRISHRSSTSWGEKKLWYIEEYGALFYCSVWSPDTSTFLPTSRGATTLEVAVTAVGRADRNRGEDRRAAEGELAPTRGERLANDCNWDSRVTPTVLALLLVIPIEESSKWRMKKKKTQNGIIYQHTFIHIKASTTFHTLYTDYNDIFASHILTCTCIIHYTYTYTYTTM